MGKTASLMLQGEMLTVQPYRGDREHGRHAGRAFLLEVADEATSNTLLASLPLLDRLLSEKLAAARERRLSEMVDFIAARILAPSTAELAMAQQLARRRAAILNEFGYFTAEQLADANGSQASNRAALADNWRKRRQAFAVPHPDRAARDRDIYPAFQFKDGKPIKAVQEVIEAFDGRKDPWKLALWFASNNGGLADNARPVDLLIGDPRAVVVAARRDAEEPAA